MTQLHRRRRSNFPESRTLSRVTLALALSCGVLTIDACGGGGDKSTGIIVDPPLATVSRVDVTSSTSTLSPTQTLQLAAVARTSDGVSVPSAPISWTSSSNSVATVNGSGLVTAFSTGSATISATSGSVTGSVTLTVVAAGGTVATVAVTLSDASIQIGGLAQANVTARDANNALLPVGTRPLVWTSSNTSIATITTGGVISAVGVGSAQFTASVTEGTKTVTNTATLTITKIPGAPASADVSMPGLTFSPADIVVKVGGTAKFIFPALEHNVFWRPTVAGAPADINTTSSKTVPLTFNTAGVFPFVCTLHDGMTGRVIVSP